METTIAVHTVAHAREKIVKKVHLFHFYFTVDRYVMKKGVFILYINAIYSNIIRHFS